MTTVDFTLIADEPLQVKYHQHVWQAIICPVYDTKWHMIKETWLLEEPSFACTPNINDGADIKSYNHRIQSQYYETKSQS